MKETERLLPLVDAIEAATGQRPHRVTAYRWSHPSRPIRIETKLVGGCRMATTADVMNFIEASTKARDEPRRVVTQGRSMAKRTRDQARADKALSKLGA